LGLLYYKLCATAKGKKHMESALAGRPAPHERRMIEQILKEQKTLDEKRFFRPDFEALRQANQAAFSFAWAKKIGSVLKKLFDIDL